MNITREQAINILIQAVGIAQEKGAFNLATSAMVYQAVVLLTGTENTEAPKNGEQ